MAAEPPAARANGLRDVVVARAGLILLGGALLVAAVRVWLTTKITTPWIMTDELLYSEVAKGIVSGGHAVVREQPISVFNIGYPLMIAPAWLFDSVSTAYAVAKTLNVLVMSLVAAPVYLWARRLVSVPLAVAATGVVLLMPAFMYGGTLMTENAFFPAVVLACLALAIAFERPTLARQGLALSAIALACLIRSQAVVFVLIVPSALALKLLLDWRAAPRAGLRSVVAELRRHLAWVGVPVVGALAYLALTALRGRPLSSALGAYQTVGTVHYSLGEAAHWVPQHFAGLVVSAGVFPFVALVVLFVLGLWRGAASPAERAFLAVAVSATFWIVIEVAVFASHFSLRIEERSFFPVVPLLVLALAVWLERGLPRPLPVAVPVSLGTAALVLLLDLHRLLNISILSDTFALIPLLRLSQKLDGGVGRVETLVTIAAFAAAVTVLVVPRRIAPVVLLGALALYFSLASYSVYGSIRDYSHVIAATAFPLDQDWVDDSLGSGENAAYLFGVGVDPGQAATTLWQTEFWNRDVGRVLDLVPEPGSLPATPVTVDRVRGRVVLPPGVESPRFIVSPDGVDLAGQPLERRGPLTLYRVGPALRLRSSTEGLYTDNWMSSDAAYSVYAGHPANVALTVSRRAWGGPDKPGKVIIEVGRLSADASGAPAIARVITRRTWVIHSNRERHFTLPAPRPPFRVVVHVSPTFSPADYGLADTRQLGAQVIFRLGSALSLQ
ncbi:MAG: hypothetical protein ABI896_03980 [Actinomycetota bacterium]